MATHRSLHRRALSSAAAIGLSASLISVPMMAPSASAQETQQYGFDLNADLDATPVQTHNTLAAWQQGEFECYRIPSMVVSPDETLIAAFDGRNPGKSWGQLDAHCPDAPAANSIVQLTRDAADPDADWSEPEVIARGEMGENNQPNYGYSDPSMLVDYEAGKIFNFFVKSFDEGIVASKLGVDPTQRDVIHAHFAVSEDNGKTWTLDNIITADVTKGHEDEWRGRWATAGNGIQITTGPYKGRLVQPAAVVTTSDKWVATAWLSDDHGETWRASEGFGTQMNENRIVQLSDGTLMNNSRRTDGGGGRYVSYSTDGGETWTEPQVDHNLTDPKNNASIIRAFPNAEPGSAQSKVLLFSNANHPSARKNGTIRMSCDDGDTWTDGYIFLAGNMQYSQLATLPSGNLGLLYENGNERYDGNNIVKSMDYQELNLAQLGQACLDVDDDTPTEVSAGNTGRVAVKIGNPWDTEFTGSIDTEVDGYRIKSDEVTLAPNGSTIILEVTAPALDKATEVTAPLTLSTRSGKEVEVELSFMAVDKTVEELETKPEPTPTPDDSTPNGSSNDSSSTAGIVVGVRAGVAAVVLGVLAALNAGPIVAMVGKWFEELGL